MIRIDRIVYLWRMSGNRIIQFTSIETTIFELPIPLLRVTIIINPIPRIKGSNC